MDIYKKCFVPGCNNDSNNSPHKIIVKIREDLRKEWCTQANVEYFNVYNMYCCEDHFDPREDLRNYYTFRAAKHKPLLKPTAKLRYISVNQVSSESQSEHSELAKLLLQDQPTTSFGRSKLEPVCTHPFQVDVAIQASVKMTDKATNVKFKTTGKISDIVPEADISEEVTLSTSLRSPSLFGCTSETGTTEAATKKEHHKRKSSNKGVKSIA